MLQLLPNGVLQDCEGVQRLWTFAELLGAADSLQGETLRERARAMRHAAAGAMQQERELDATTLRNARFWSLVRPEGIETYAASYSLTITDTYNWRLELTADGLIYNDLSGLYLRAGQEDCQLLHEFWFSGPLLPIPGFEMRRGLLERIRSGFRDDVPEDVGRHFPLFEYPAQPVAVPLWEDGDERVKDYVVIRPYGIESGRWNFHDGDMYRRFLSFESYLVEPGAARESLGEAGFQLVGDYLTRVPPDKRLDIKPEDPLTASKRWYLEYLGDLEALHRDGWSDSFSASAGEESAWKAELIEWGLKALEQEKNPEVLRRWIRTLTFHGVPALADKVFEAGKRADLLQRQSLAMVLESEWQDPRATELVFSLVAQDPSDSYWFQYVVQYCWKHFGDPMVKSEVVKWLQGTDEIPFRKALDVLHYWQYRGDLPSFPKELFAGLDWEKKLKGDAEFRKSLQEILSIVRKTA